MGPVKYNVNTFLEKNRNSLSLILCSTMYNGTHPLLKSLFPEGKYIFLYYYITYKLFLVVDLKQFVENYMKVRLILLI